MEDVMILAEIAKINMEIKKFNKKVNDLEKQIHSCEKGLDELSDYKSKVDNTLNSENAKWKEICNGLPCVRFNANCENKTAQLFAGEKYYNFKSIISEHKNSLNNEIITCEESMRLYQNKIRIAEEKLQELKNKMVF